MSDVQKGLPRGWVRTKVSEIAELIRGVSYKKETASKEPRNGYLPVLRANNIDTEIILQDFIYAPKANIHEEQKVKQGDIVIAMSSGSKNLVGKAGQAKEDFEGGFGTFCGLIRPSNETNKQFMGYFFHSPDYRRAIFELSSGVNICNLRRDHIESLPIPLPPLPEQKRIVTKMEELFSDLDAGVETLKKLQAQIKRYRQSVLKSAFEGKLTKEWRKQQQGKLEPASVLLERIKEERKKKLGKKYKELPPVDTTDLPELPKEWEWAKLAILCETVTDGDHQPPPKSNEGIPFLVISDISDGKLNFTNTRFVSKSYYDAIRSDRKPKKGDILYSVTGSFGIPVLVESDNNFCFQRHIGLLRPVSTVNKRYLLYAMKSAVVFAQATKMATGTAQKTVPLSGLRAFNIAIPSALEQHRIVQEIESRFSIADKVEEIIESSLKQSKRLRQSILKMAFEGKLVPQNPKDEPADKLLERIIMEKEIKTKRKHPNEQTA